MLQSQPFSLDFKLLHVREWIVLTMLFQTIEVGKVFKIIKMPLKTRTAENQYTGACFDILRFSLL